MFLSEDIYREDVVRPNRDRPVQLDGNSWVINGVPPLWIVSDMWVSLSVLQGMTPSRPSMTSRPTTPRRYGPQQSLRFGDYHMNENVFL
jgi:hypothetical protein